jgi:hypothetical protein
MRKFMVAVVLGLMPAVGQACTYLEPFEIGRIGAAEIVVVGKVTGYEPLPVHGVGAALVTVAVEEVLKGEAAGEVTFVWNGGMAQGPHESRATGRVLIGAAKGGRAVNPMWPDARPDLPSMVQPYCGEVWMVPATKASVAEARKVLK